MEQVNSNGHALTIELKGDPAKAKDFLHDFHAKGKIEQPSVSGKPLLTLYTSKPITDTVTLKLNQAQVHKLIYPSYSQEGTVKYEPMKEPEYFDGDLWEILECEPDPNARRIDSAADLYDADLPEIIFYIYEWLMVGVGWLAGEPKVGKSFLALQMAVSIAGGRPFLQTISGSPFQGFDVLQAPVLYYSLEMAPNLMQDRLHSMLPSGRIPSDLKIMYDLPRFDQGGYDVLRNDIKETRARVVFVDVHGLVSAKKSSQNPLYEQTYDEIAPLREIAESTDSCIVLLTHLNKNSDNSLFNRMMGSTANRGSSDFNIVMAKAKDGQTMVMEESRKSEGLEVILKWNYRPAKFEYVSTVDEMVKEKKREEYLTDPVVNAIKVILQSRDRAEVTCAELLELMPEWASKDYTPQRIGKQINKLKGSLQFYDQIAYDTERRSNKRAYVFTKPRNAELSPIMDDFLPKTEVSDDQHVTLPMIEMAKKAGTYK